MGWKPDALFLNWFGFQQMRLVDDDGSKASEGRGRAPATKFQKRSTSAYPATPNQANTNHPILSSTHILCCYLRRKWVIDLIMICFFNGVPIIFRSPCRGLIWTLTAARHFPGVARQGCPGPIMSPWLMEGSILVPLENGIPSGKHS